MVEALVVIDIVRDSFGLPVPLHEPERFGANGAELRARARAAGAWSIHIQPTGAEGTRYAPGAPGRQFHPQTAPVAGEIVIEKYHPAAFHGTNLEELLVDRGVGGIAMCGIASDYCVDATVRSGYAHRFDVVLAADAHTTTANEVLSAADTISHHNVVLQRFAKITPAADIQFQRAD